jgi:hypothetical protein
MGLFIVGSYANQANTTLLNHQKPWHWMASPLKDFLNDSSQKMVEYSTK